MKNNVLKICLLIVNLLIFNSSIYSQRKFEVGIGTGFPDYLNMKIRYGNNLQLGISKSFRALDEIKLNPINAELYIHFAGKKQNDQHPFYFLGGYSFQGTNYWTRGYRYIYSMLGISFVGNKVGVNFDAGLIFPNKEFEEYFMGGPILFSFSLSLYLRL
jgi:hypothetical protein